jgi:hypothetical protein
MFKKCITDTFVHSGKNLKRKNELCKIQKKMMMLLHEYQAQGLLKKYGVPVPRVNLNFIKLFLSYHQINF